MVMILMETISYSPTPSYSYSFEGDLTIYYVHPHKMLLLTIFFTNNDSKDLLTTISGSPNKIILI